VAVSIIDKYLAASPAELPTVVAVHVQQEALAEQTPSLEVVLDLAQRGVAGDRLRLTFTGVRNLCLRQPSWSLFEIKFLEIRDVSSDQWEGVRFIVNDPENDSISLQCADIKVEVAGRPGNERR
jgi:hypothetical protein